MNTDITAALQEAVRRAADNKTPLQIIGSGSKAFYGRSTQGLPLQLGAHRRIVEYEPSELVITACAGTPLAEIEAALAEHNQMLAFEPPHFSGSATLGGTLACGLSGPRRPYAGAARDFVLGMKIINGNGELLSFGGQVMKNVAGYDVSRLMVGALGTLGVLLEVSLKVLPRPAEELTLVHEAAADEAIRTMNEWAGHALPLSACAYDGIHLYVRLSGTDTALHAARLKLGGERIDDGAAYWTSVREHRHDFFSSAAPLWRLSVPPAAAPIDLPGQWFLDWGGAQRWLRSRYIRRYDPRSGGRRRRACHAVPRRRPQCSVSIATGTVTRRAATPQAVLRPARHPESRTTLCGIVNSLMRRN